MTTPGRRAIEDDEQALVDRLAEAVAAAYVALTPDVRALDEPALAVVLSVYWDGADASHWGPPPKAVTERSPALVPPGEVLWMAGTYEVAMHELAWPDVYQDPALRAPGEALLALVHERDAWELPHAFFYALTARLAAAWGVPVAWDDFEDGRATPPDEQLRAQLDAATAADWERRGLLPVSGRDRRDAQAPSDALLTLVRADGIVAGVDARRSLSADLRHRGGPIVDAGVTMTGDAGVTVVGGVLPGGATAARVQDLYDAWHDATVSGELWACALPHGARGGLPPVVFADAGGAEVTPAPPEAQDMGPWLTVSLGDGGTFDAAAAEAEAAAWDARVLRGARVPVLWDDALGAGPSLGQVGGDEDAASSVELRRDDASVAVTDGGDWSIDDPEREARDLLEEALARRGDARAAGRAALEVVPAPLPAVIAGREETLLLVAGGGAWVAVWTDRRTKLDVRVQGTGAPPARLDLTDRRG